jgi:hypothetical protein
MHFDPAQMQQRMLERYKDLLQVTDKDEWSALKPLIQKVMDARLAALAIRVPGQSTSGLPEAEALQKCIDAKAATSEIQAALAKCVAARQKKQAELLQAQDNLRQVLTARQEAIAALNGLL